MADMVARNRSAHGERQGNAKLTSEAVEFIIASKDSHSSLARRFGVSRKAIYLVRKGVTWRKLVS